jgi:anti-sigma factor RsiW
MAIPGIGPVVAAGWLASTAAGAATGAIVGGAAGGLIGAMTETGMSREDAETYAESVRRGGSLVSVRTDEASEQQASNALDAVSSLDVDSQRAAWRREGWAGFDPDAAPYPRERMPYGRSGRI